MNNSEILFIYDSKLSNPNGDPDEENRPRMDYERDINLVSDLRLKRFIRDYICDKGYDIFVRKLDDKSVTAEKRMESFKNSSEDEILESLVDVRLFGATMPIKGDNKTFIGPVQFNWGYSLNRVELLEASITSHFKTNEKAQQGTIGKDYRVKYSLIAFSGVISGKRALKTKLKESDVDLLDKALRYSIQNHATRSKIGEYPRLYIRTVYKDDETILGDFRDYIKLNEKIENVRDIKEISLDITSLYNHLKLNSEKIDKIVYFSDDSLELVLNGNTTTLLEALKEFNLCEVR
ncbi:type I-B CRISPR-associated protein Cas7/Csh2 [Caloramator sp. E03]|uniref:type I-B CRISPR-associated protein Cas7/Csh2 n=1 Tax=Caloramator sp. E03 TaxID=2576307 RepID=UPI001A9BF7B5|nr:type I-B CRISPR-associated protein Cas7/Csh2 [Caloramator sp. E03]